MRLPRDLSKRKLNSCINIYCELEIIEKRFVRDFYGELYMVALILLRSLVDTTVAEYQCRFLGTNLSVVIIIQPLKAWAVTKYQEVVRTMWSSNSFTESARLIWCGSLLFGILEITVAG